MRDDGGSKCGEGGRGGFIVDGELAEDGHEGVAAGWIHRHDEPGKRDGAADGGGA